MYLQGTIIIVKVDPSPYMICSELRFCDYKKVVFIHNADLPI